MAPLAEKETQGKKNKDGIETEIKDNTSDTEREMESNSQSERQREVAQRGNTLKQEVLRQTAMLLSQWSNTKT